MQKRGFTLAEVLITLAIIGVVAALTIPTVVRNYQKQQTAVRLKKAYNALSNTTNLAIANHGPVTGWEVYSSEATVPGTSVKGSEHFANTYLIPYLKISKNCKTETTGVCRFVYRYMNSSTQRTCNSDYYRFYLNDGVFISLASSNYTNSDGTRMETVNILIDVNGQKGPNIMGRDVFSYRYYVVQMTQTSSYNGKFMPSGFMYTRAQMLNSASDSNACSKTGTGRICAALIMKDGWQIADDYP